MYGREAYIYHKMWLIFQLVDSIERNETRAFVKVAFSIVACQKGLYLSSEFCFSESVACVENTNKQHFHWRIKSFGFHVFSAVL